MSRAVFFACFARFLFFKSSQHEKGEKCFLRVSLISSFNLNPTEDTRRAIAKTFPLENLKLNLQGFVNPLKISLKLNLIKFFLLS